MSQPISLAVAQQRAKAIYEAGDPPAARHLLAEVIEAARPGYGEDHPDVLVSAHLLAQLHRAADDPAAARRVLEEALAAGQRRWGDGDPVILAISFELGTVADELGNRHEARRNFTRVATAGAASLGEEYWTVRAARAYLLRAAALARTATGAETPTAGITDPDAAGPGSLAHFPHRTEPGRTELLVRAFRRPGSAVLAGAAAGAAALLLATGVAVVATALSPDRAPVPADTTASPTGRTPTPYAVVDAAPADLRLRDDGSSMTVTWTDPSDGTVPFVVAGGRAGQTLGALATVDPGGTSYTVHGLNQGLDYCFTVLAVHATDRFAASGQVCTARSGSPTPG